MKSKTRKKTVRISRDNLRNAIAFFLQSMNVITSNKDISLMYLGNPNLEDGYFIDLSLGDTKKETIDVTYTEYYPEKKKGVRIIKING